MRRPSQRLNQARKKDRYLSRLLYELKAISPDQFNLLSKRLADITKQSQAWFKWVRDQERKGSYTSPALAFVRPFWAASKEPPITLPGETIKYEVNRQNHTLKSVP